MSDAHSGALAHKFDSLEQQKESATLGMWLFLAQEVMFFGGLFAAYTFYRAAYPQAWNAASNHLTLSWGFINTLVLLCSSLTMATAAHYAQKGDTRRLVNYLLLTIFLGCAFLGIKVIEYTDKYHHHLIPGYNFHWEGPENPGNVELFYILYFLMTGMHALHMIIGVAIMGVLAYLAARKKKFVSGDYMAVELSGYYWHFVDIVWVYLFPLLYLIDRSHHV